MSYIKAKDWPKTDLFGSWDVTFKIDGVRILVRDGKVTTRNNKEIYNLDNLKLKDNSDYELFCGNFDLTSSKARTKLGGTPFTQDEAYRLHPYIDDRLYCCTYENPTKLEIEARLKDALDLGYEGLVLTQGSTWYKVKPSDTYDVEVVSIIEGKGKHKGRMGALMTTMGKVGTGFSDKERELGAIPIGSLIEVECMGLTKNGLFRHPRFKRIRWDK